MKKILIILIALVMVSVVTATATLFLFPYQPDQPPQADDTGSTQQGIQEVVDANNKFAFELYSEIDKSEQGNMFYSPYSMSAALAMTYEGAEGQTAEEMKSVFHFPENSILRSNFAAIYNEINRGGKPYKLSTGNALWVNQDYKLLDEYISIVEKYYGGKAANVDFVKENEKTRQTINAFIEEQTNNKIKDLISQGNLDTLTRLVITNAVYFKGTWLTQFDKADTNEEDFRTDSENTVKVQMMRLTDEKFDYAENDEIQILEMPYEGEDVSMLIILPKEDNLENVEGSIDAEKLAEWESMLRRERVNVFIPKFKLETKYLLSDTLSNMGMPTAFSEGDANFSGMDGTQKLYIGNVIHQAFVEVDEEGTEAAAATAVSIVALTSKPIIQTFRADHPFIFMIQEKTTGNILFMGRVIDPTK
jgi:serpin B